MAADSAMDQITTALSEASLRKGETERLKEDLAINEKATQGRKGDIEQVSPCGGSSTLSEALVNFVAVCVILGAALVRILCSFCYHNHLLKGQFYNTVLNYLLFFRVCLT